jgi:hypothetical protein
VLRSIGPKGQFITGCALVLAACIVLGPGVAADDVPTRGSSVEVHHTPAATQGACRPALMAMSHRVLETPTSFTVRVITSAPLCPPIHAAAVVYAMPTDGRRWPQQLLERVDVTFSAAGVTDVVFAKGCEPVQFDLITGPSPQTISPTGAWHGPLLFPLDRRSSLQHPGGGERCTTIPSTVPSTTVPPSTVPSTTVPPSTVPPSTVPPTTDPEVLGATTIPTTAPAPAPEVVSALVGGRSAFGSTPSALALTGSGRSSLEVLLGAGLLLTGVALVAMSRRRLRAA